MGYWLDKIKREWGDKPQDPLSMASYALDHLEAQTELLDSKESQTFRWVSTTQLSGGATSGQVSLPHAPPGVDYIGERVMVATSPGGAATVEVYLDSVDVTNLVEGTVTLSARGFYADAFNNNIFVPQNRGLVFDFNGAPANSLLVAGVQVKRAVDRSRHEVHNLTGMAT